MENNTGYALGFGLHTRSEEEIQAREKRMTEKKELQQNVERVAKLLLEKIEAELIQGSNEHYNNMDCAEALKSVSDALTRIEGYASTPLDMLSSWGGLAAK